MQGPPPRSSIEEMVMRFIGSSPISDHLKSARSPYLILEINPERALSDFRKSIRSYSELPMKCRGRGFPEQGPVFAGEAPEMPEAIPRRDVGHCRRVRR